MLDELYKQYGELLIQAEILQGRINEVKKQIAAELSKPKVEEKCQQETATDTK